MSFSAVIFCIDFGYKVNFVGTSRPDESLPYKWVGVRSYGRTRYSYGVNRTFES
jgi:hypothetical protein